jgi:hypothetical protein
VPVALLACVQQAGLVWRALSQFQLQLWPLVLQEQHVRQTAVVTAYVQTTTRVAFGASVQQDSWDHPALSQASARLIAISMGFVFSDIVCVPRALLDEHATAWHTYRRMSTCCTRLETKCDCALVVARGMVYAWQMTEGR